MRYEAWGTLLVALTGLLLVLPDRIAADLMGDIQQGLKTTGKLFGINTIADVADLVAKGFATRRGSQEPQRPVEAQPTEGVGVVDGLLGQAPSMMTIMMKLLGLDGSQLGAMLVNGIVFLAHIIGTNLGAFRSPALGDAPLPAQSSSSFSPYSTVPPLTGESEPSQSNENPKPSSGGNNPLDWLLRNPSKRFRVLLDQVKNTDLAERLDHEMDQLDRYVPEDTDCIRLLMCKVKPFIWKMQNVVRDNVLVRPNGPQQSSDSSGGSEQTDKSPTSAPNGEEILKGIHANLPSEEEFQRQSKLCEQQFRHCRRVLG